MADPFREQRLPPPEVRRILRRAVELAERDPEAATYERSLTREELGRAAGELGLSTGVVARASEAPGEDEAAPVRGERSVLLGAPTRFVLEAEVGGEPSEPDREDVIEDIRDAMGETGAVESVGKTLVWKLVPVYGGRARDVSVRLRPRNGRTRIIVEERLTRQATGLFVGLGVGGGLGPTGGYIAAIAKLGAVGLVFPLLWIPLMLLLARTIYVGLAHRRKRALRDVMRRLTRRAAEWSRPAAPRRVRVAGVAGGADAEGEAEADAEAEAAQGAGSRARR